MQYCSVMVALGGDLNNTVQRDNVSVPEIGVLIGLHGVDGVTRIEGSTDDRPVNHTAEYDRIANFYGDENTTRILGQKTFNLTLPTRLSAVFQDVADEPAPQFGEAEEAPAPPAKRGLKLTPKADVPADDLLDA